VLDLYKRRISKKLQMALWRVLDLYKHQPNNSLKLG
jgi:hypothetical protein